MLAPAEVQPIMERMIEDGEDRREKIVEAVAREVEMDMQSLRRLAADKGVSLALAAMRDEDGERLAYPSRNEDGVRTVVHVELTKDPRALHRAGVRMEKRGEKMAKSGRRLQERAIQLGLFDDDEPEAEAA